MGADLAAEEQFGPYLVYERLGVGGMATVHRALERGIEGFERIVALKRLLPHLAEDASFIKSFVREAKLASLLNHNNIVQIFELGRVGTEYFISMEYIDGRDIRRILRHARKVTGPPPIHVTVGILLQLCDALDYAHSKVDDEGHPLGLVHRDVSPSNLLITSAGHLKVIDFGIAKAQSSQLRTQTGRVKGKLAYMAPEAITGKELDSRSDLFAAGVIAHELLTARPLFASKNEYQTLLKVQRGDIMPPSTFNQACPPELDAIVLQALARDPDERFADASEVRDELLALRKRHNLQTGHRDLAQWLDWAFSLEPPSSGFAAQNTFDQTESVVENAAGFEVAVAAHSSRPQTKPPREEDEAVEIAWGGGEPEAAEPLLHDDVPDVSDKHLAAPRLDTGADLDDDIPASQPSHGVQRPVRDTQPSPVVAPPDEPVRPSERPASRSTPPPIPDRRPSGSHPALRSPPSTPPANRRTTAQGSGAADPDPDRSSGPELAAPRHARSLSELALAHEEPRDTQPSLPPVVRFREPTIPPVARIGTTRPGMAPVRPALGTLAEVDVDLEAETPPPRTKRPSNITIGSAIVARQSVRGRTWVLVVGIVACGAAATAITLYATRGQDTVSAVSEVVTPVPSKSHGTVKFVIEPTDVEITIEGQTHVGSPWSAQLEPGIHQIQIHRDGYKARLTSIELLANETTTMIISLERLGAQAVPEANLILSSTPLGLEVVLDGQLLAQRTPIKMPISTGPHTIVLRQNGVDVWRHQLIAQDNVDHEFNPSMDKHRKPRAPAGDEAPPPRKAPPPPPPPATKPDPAGEPPANPTDQQAPTPIVVAPPTPPVSTPPPPTPTPPAPVPTPAVVTPVPTPRPVPITIPSKGPITVAPTVVTRIAGETPTLGKSRRVEVPPVIAAKVCIDPGGAVTSVDMITKLERHTVLDLTHTIRAWRYAPFKQAGVAVAACFVVSFRVK